MKGFVVEISVTEGSTGICEVATIIDSWEESPLIVEWMEGGM